MILKDRREYRYIDTILRAWTKEMHLEGIKGDLTTTTDL